ncbi:MAG TPA: hypothetical protein VGJ02_00275 [Pyrinomonadaceae bacterium]
MLRILIGLAAVWVFAGGFHTVTTSACARDGAEQRECKPCKRPDGTLNHAPNVTDLVLDQNQIRLPDPVPGQPADSLPAVLINVAANAVDAENDVLDYSYVVSAGHIVGSGSAVEWDLSGVGPGNYTITAKVDDSCGVCGATKTKLVRLIGKTPLIATPAVAAAPATPAARSVSIRPTEPTQALTKTTSMVASTSAQAPKITCSCPKISIADPEKEGSDLIFTTNIDGLFSNQLSFIWTVIGGKVVSQDKRTIRINPGNVAVGGSVNVVVNGLEPRCSCPNQVQKTF